MEQKPRPHAPVTKKVRQAPPPPETSHAKYPHHDHHHHGTHSRHKQTSVWVWVGLGAVAFALLLILPPVFGAGSYFREEATPQGLLTQAENQLKNGEMTRALDSCKLADLREPDSETRQRIQALRDRITAQLGREKDQPKLDVAQRSLEAMQQFEAQYLTTGKPRPAARELTRNAQRWLQNYSEVLRLYPDHAAAVPKVQNMFDRFAPEAKIEQPDVAADVLFAVERRLSLPRPLYRDAVTMVDDYLRAHPGDTGTKELKASKDAVVKAARAEFDRHETEARRLLAARRFAEAKKALDEMRNAIVVEAWGQLADAVDRDIQRAEK